MTNTNIISKQIYIIYTQLVYYDTIYILVIKYCYSQYLSFSDIIPITGIKYLQFDRYKITLHIQFGDNMILFTSDSVIQGVPKMATNLLL